MLMAVNEPYALMVQPDDILISPREVDEHFGTMVCFHPRYALGDHHNYMDKDDFLREMYLDTVGHDEAGMKRYERMVNIVSSRFRHGPKTEERAIDEAMQKVISEKYLMLPLYLYDHSGLAMSTESFSGRAPHAEWDSGQVGWIYVSKEDALREFDADKMTGAIRQKADALMRSEVAAYDSYLRGECYGFELVQKYPDIYQYTGIWMEDITHTTARGSTPFTLSSTNKLLKQYQWATGLKTGSTAKAKYCLSATARKDGIDLITVDRKSVV